jgi:type I restriction enzyme S subunit
MEEWKEYKLGDVLTIKYGKDHKQLADGDIPIYGSGGIMRYGERSLYDGPSILIPRKGSLNNIMYSDKPFWTVDTMFWSIINNTVANPLFVYYSICKKDFASLNVGSAVPSLTVPVIEDIDILLPSLAEQKQIVSILKSLDDKIEVNRKTNENLEQEAQALFKSWFVDFEPFKNGEFIESELGRIPKGWRVGTLGEIGDIVGGSTPSKSKPEYYTDKGIAWLTPKDLSISNNKFTSKGEKDITEEGYKSCSTKLMPKGAVLFSSRAPIGYITIAKNDICTNQGFKSVVPKLAGTAFIYFFLKLSTKDIENKATGSTFKEASGALMKSLQLIIAPERILHDFESLMKPLFTQQEVLEDESRYLAELRDTLLPKLMSGELKVNEIEDVL